MEIREARDRGEVEAAIALFTEQIGSWDGDRRNATRWLVATESDVLIGALEFSPDWEGARTLLEAVPNLDRHLLEVYVREIWSIIHVAVAPEWARRGIGTMLLADCRRIATDFGATTLIGFMHAPFTATPFYERNGGHVLAPGDPLLLSLAATTKTTQVVVRPKDSLMCAFAVGLHAEASAADEEVEPHSHVQQGRSWEPTTTIQAQPAQQRGLRWLHRAKRWLRGDS